MHQIQERYQKIKHQIGSAKLIAVSKKQPQIKLEQALEAGLKDFGENRVQEAYEHWQELKKEHFDITLHLIAPLQSNKVKEAVALFDVIHTVDREKIARALSKEMRLQNKKIPCFIQVNTGNEPQKSGVTFQELESFYDLCTHECALDIIGLMAIPPHDESSEKHFISLRNAAEMLGLKELSMGMSSDYTCAVKCGSTYVRIGAGLFGARL